MYVLQGTERSHPSSNSQAISSGFCSKKNSGCAFHTVKPVRPGQQKSLSAITHLS